MSSSHGLPTDVKEPSNIEIKRIVRKKEEQITYIPEPHVEEEEQEIEGEHTTHVERVVVPQVCEVPKIVQDKYLKKRYVERIVEVPVPQEKLEVVEVPRIVEIPRHVPVIVKVRKPQVIEKIVSVPVVQLERKNVKASDVTAHETYESFLVNRVAVDRAPGIPMIETSNEDCII